MKTICTGIEMFRKILDEARAGENVGLLLRGIKREDVERGMVVVKPGTNTPHTEFEATVYILSKEEGGRHTPFFQNYRPQFYFRTTDVTGVVTLPEGTDMVMPGDNTSDDGPADPADRDGGRPQVRDPRGWPHRRRRPGHQDHQVGRTSPSVGGGRSTIDTFGSRSRPPALTTECREDPRFHIAAGDTAYYNRLRRRRDGRWRAHERCDSVRASRLDHRDRPRRAG